MKKKDLLKRIEALEKQFDILSDEVMDLEVEKQMQPCPTAEKFKAIADHANSINDVIQNAPKDDTIYVPDGILNKDMDIVNGKMILWHDEYGWNVHSSDRISLSKPNQFKLVPLNREDLKVGDVAFRTSFDKPTFDNLSKYCIVLEYGCQYWNQRECQFDDMSYNHWYKVVEA